MVPPIKSDYKQYIPKSWGQDGYYWAFLNAQKVQQMLNTSAKGNNFVMNYCVNEWIQEWSQFLFIPAEKWGWDL